MPEIDQDVRNAICEELSRNLGGQVVNLQSPPGGESRTFWSFDLLRDGELLKLAALQNAGAGPFYGTRYNMAREARTLRALAAANFAVPHMHYVSEDGDLMVLEKLSGKAEFSFDTPEQRKSTISDFAKQLVALHRIDPAKLDLPYAPASTRSAATLADLDDLEEAYLRMCKRHAIVDDAFEWARQSVPLDDARPSILQGDAGPTNFLHEGGKLTGFVDWEMTHCGDPADDLAWVWFRVSMLGLDENIEDWMAAYVGAGGEAPSEAKLLYYVTLVTLRCTIANLVRQANDPGSSDERAARTRSMLEAAMSDARETGPRKLPALGIA